MAQAPEAPYPVDVTRAAHELALPVVDSEVLRISDIDQAVIAAPAVGVDDRFGSHAIADNGLESGFLAVGDDLRINAAVTLGDAEDDGLTRRPAASLAAHAACAGVRLIHFDFALREERGALALVGNTSSNSEKDRGHAAARKSRQLGRVTGRQIEREVAHEPAEFTLRNFRPPVVAV